LELVEEELKKSKLEVRSSLFDHQITNQKCHNICPVDKFVEQNWMKLQLSRIPLQDPIGRSFVQEILSKDKLDHTFL
jgi:hypothetical protein